MGEFVPQAVTQIPWGHNIVILEQVKDHEARLYYVRNSAEYGWSRNVLVHQIETDSYSRHALTPKTTNFQEALPAPIGDLAQGIVKDPYGGSGILLARNRLTYWD